MIFEPHSHLHTRQILQRSSGQSSSKVRYRHPVLGYISQPAHAALSGMLAASLNGKLFSEVPEEVIAAIGNHDAGWAQPDLAALEDAERIFPLSFISTPAVIS